MGFKSQWRPWAIALKRRCRSLEIWPSTFKSWKEVLLLKTLIKTSFRWSSKIKFKIWAKTKARSLANRITLSRLKRMKGRRSKTKPKTKQLKSRRGKRRRNWRQRQPTLRFLKSSRPTWKSALTRSTVSLSFLLRRPTCWTNWKWFSQWSRNQTIRQWSRTWRPLL